MFRLHKALQSIPSTGSGESLQKVVSKPVTWLSVHQVLAVQALQPPNSFISGTDIKVEGENQALRPPHTQPLISYIHSKNKYRKMNPKKRLGLYR